MNSRRISATIFSVLLCVASFLSLPLSFGSGSAAAAEIDNVSISELIENMVEYDGDTVIVTGEVIGDIMVRGDHAWITVNDGSYSKNNLEEGGEFTGVSNIGIGVWVPHQEVTPIKNLGGYKKKGDIVEVVGVFHRACPEHGGDTDIHAVSIMVVEEGGPIEHPLDYSKLLFAAILACLMVFILSIWLKQKRGPERR